jgi:molecular chaperone DnaK (HSP70)
MRYLLFYSQELFQRPQDISARVLTKLRESAEQALNLRSNVAPKKITRAVVTVPAYFSMAQKSETLEAAQIAGLTDVQLITEPAAGIIRNLRTIFFINYSCLCIRL